MRSTKLILILLFTVLFSCEEEPLPLEGFKLSMSSTPEEAGKINFTPWHSLYPKGISVTLTPEPNENWVFQKWEGDVSGASSPLELKMDSDKRVIAVFVKKNYGLDYTIIGEGIVSEKVVENPSGREYPHGTTVELTPIPKEGWVFESWGEYGAETNGGYWEYLISNEIPIIALIDAPKTLIVTFVPKPQGEPRFYLAENGITCKCENVIAGQKGILNGDEFEAVNNEFLRQRFVEKADMTKLCTSLVTDMSNLFEFSYFNQPIGNWDVSKVSDMSNMFYGSAFNQPIGAWNVSKVTNMQDMFAGGLGADGFYEAFFNQAIGEWDVSNVTKMDGMFSKNTDFNQDLSKWCVAKIPTIPIDFTNSAWTLPKPVWGTCPD
ncbi:BspA family leucine-rich repeat surface protein [Cognataquiflexum rubidum]|uniref:BspA family leucine-rich repeat surface protein n=1 Tax=Cognataquiflexum rubidum TaxID=2922273 RepID=UPI001F13D89B|nr:BspA family leucine-rich repeat surface protein [Cognataquiflexum rubidum]MCH6236182.1 BspA family leucine-rich repeat surface protein [Cognataquiflexum rubidum]